MIHYTDERVTLHHGDCLDVLRELPDASIDAVVTDPPYSISFMGRGWDAHATPGEFQHWCEQWAAECLRVLKPGGHLLAFGGSRTWHRLAAGIEDAGFEMRDSIAWLYGSGFPKSLDVGKALDKARDDRDAVLTVTTALADLAEAAGITRGALDAHMGTSDMGGWWLSKLRHRCACPSVDNWTRLRDFIPGAPALDDLVWRLNGRKGTPGEAWDRREVVGAANVPVGHAFAGATYGGDSSGRVVDLTAPATDLARQWHGWGTSLKPAFEPVLCARKPFNAVPLWETVNAVHHALGGLLWLTTSPARRAELDSPSSPRALPAGTCASALASAALDTSPGASDATDTYSSPALASTSSSIVTSWNAILATLSDSTTTSTTSTASSMTTALRILSSLLAPITSPTTMPHCACLTGGQSSPAPNASKSSTDEWANWRNTLSRSVPETAGEGIALAVASALAVIAADLSSDPVAEPTAPPTATTKADAGRSTIVVARKPLAGTVASNVTAWGTGALNIDATRVRMSQEDADFIRKTARPNTAGQEHVGGVMNRPKAPTVNVNEAGRWPTNVVMTHSASCGTVDQPGPCVEGCPVRELDAQSGTLTSGSGDRGSTARIGGIMGKDGQRSTPYERAGDSGGASRFFPTFRYEAKAPTIERPRVKVDGAGEGRVLGKGLSDQVRECRVCGNRTIGGGNGREPNCGHGDFAFVPTAARSEHVSHPTVKPLDLMRWLVRLVVPPGGTCLEPFAGSGTTAEACVIEGMHCIAIEREADYLPLIVARLSKPIELDLFGGVA